MVMNLTPPPKSVSLAFVLLLGGVSLLLGSVPAPASAPNADAIRVAQIGTPYLVSTVVLGWYSDGSSAIITDSPTPFPTWTPEVTDTPTSTPSPTATATHTPPPVVTATPSPTVTPEPTATPETVMTCQLLAQHGLDYDIYIRPEPATNNEPIGKWIRGTLSVIDEFRQIDPYVWAHHLYVSATGEFVAGWSVVAVLSGEFQWWMYTPETGPLCQGVKGWGGWPNPPPVPQPNAALLWHTVPGFNIGNAQISYEILRSKQISFGLKPYAGLTACIDALDRGGVCIFRHGAPDCPQSIGSADPRQSARDFLSYGQAARDFLARYDSAWYEPLNECNFGGSQSDSQLSIIYWWSDWLDEYVNQSIALGFTRLVIPTFGPGHGEPVQYRIWKDVLNRLAGVGGMMGEHAYTPNITGGLCGCDEWLACRHRKNEDWRQAEGVDINVAITEAARGFGNDPVDVKDFVCWYEQVRHDEFLHSVALWTAGHHPSWPNANLDAYMVPIAQGVGG